MSSELPYIHRMAYSGSRALDNGLGISPAHFDEAEGYPLAFWKSQRHGVVILLTFGSQFDTVKSPQILHINYERVNANWDAARGRRWESSYWATAQQSRPRSNRFLMVER